MLKIKPIPTRKDKIKQPSLCKSDVIPRINSSVLLVGHSGSGKTTLLANLMMRVDMYKKAFDEVFLISPTAKSDDIQKYLGLDDEHIVDELSEAPALLKTLMDEQRQAIEEKGAHKAPLIAILFDDVIADKNLLAAPEFVKCFIACRHYNFTTLICSQSFKGVPRKCRLQANNVFFFRGSNSEMEAVLEDRSPPHMNKKQGLAMIEFATQTPFSFLHINMRKPFETRYTRNLDQTINYTIQKGGPADAGGVRGAKPLGIISQKEHHGNKIGKGPVREIKGHKEARGTKRKRGGEHPGSQ